MAGKKIELLDFKKVRDGKYLKNYEITYLNKAGKEKKYEIVSRRELANADDLGGKPSGVSIVATCGDRLLLLHEFRMGVNKTIYNLCAGMLEQDESIEDCIARELYEETGLTVKKIKKILPPSFAAVAISDTTTYIAFVEVNENSYYNSCYIDASDHSDASSHETSAHDNFEDHTSDNEQIKACLYTRDEVKRLLETEPFSSRAQMAAYFFAEQAPW